MDNSSLQHWGIKGMKWGIRRFQNKDGSRTPAGRKRYDGDDADAKKNMSKSEMKKAKKRKLSELSDSELQDKIKRLEMEKRYRDLKKDSEQIDKGKSAVRDYLVSSGKKILLDTASDLAAQTVKHFMAKGINKYIGDVDKDGNIVDRVFANNKKKS